MEARGPDQALQLFLSGPPAAVIFLNVWQILKSLFGNALLLLY